MRRTTTKTLWVMVKSNQGRSMKAKWEEDLKPTLKGMVLGFSPLLQASNTRCPAFLQHQAKLARLKNLYMVLTLCLKLKLVV
jgi:hypothetical protein